MPWLKHNGREQDSNSTLLNSHFVPAGSHFKSRTLCCQQKSWTSFAIGTTNFCRIFERNSKQWRSSQSFATTRQVNMHSELVDFRRYSQRSSDMRITWSNRSNWPRDSMTSASW